MKSIFFSGAVPASYWVVILLLLVPCPQCVLQVEREVQQPLQRLLSR